MPSVDLRELTVVLLTAVLPVALAELRRRRRRRARRAGRLRTRAGDWKPRSSGAAVWLTDDDQDHGDESQNGRGDVRDEG